MMATLVLQTIGQARGGPLGGMVSGLIGQRLDSLWMGKKTRGPRLGDLAVQTSAYGTPLPKLYGTTRVAGTVIWATDLREEKQKRSGGKGQPKIETYSYSVSLAVALSAREIQDIGAIWADGNLLRGRQGDLKVATRMRVYRGTEDQPVDPIIAASEGVDRTPAYRGLAYVVLEDLQLAAYGNRIPSLSFEVIAEARPVAVGDVLADLSGGLIMPSPDTSPVTGVAVVGETLGAVVETLLPDRRDALYDRFTALSLEATGVSHLVPRHELGAQADGTPTPKVREQCGGDDSLPTRLEVAYVDPERAHQLGLQRARMPKGLEHGPPVWERVDYPVAIAAGEAKLLAERWLARRWAERRVLSITLPWRWVGIRTGDEILWGGNSWAVTGLRFEQMCVHIDARILRRLGQGDTAADPGQIREEPDLPHGPTVLAMVDLPQLGLTPVDRPIVGIFAGGTLPGWRRAALSASRDGQNWESAGASASPAIIGRLIAALPAAPAEWVDRAHSVDVELANPAMVLGDADEGAILAGANLALFGSEMVQFERAHPLSDRRYRLSGLWRGRCGTESHIASWEPGAQFLLVSAELFKNLQNDLCVPGVQIMATGIADPVPPVVQLGSVGRARLPFSPCHLQAETAGDGAIVINWIRRSRAGGQWLDAIEVPLVEERERYWVTVHPENSPERSVEVSACQWVYTAAEREQDKAAGARTATVIVRQGGTFGFSEPQSVRFAL